MKFRESFRPLASSVLEECTREYFDLDRESPYMLQVAPVWEEPLPPATGDFPLPAADRPIHARAVIPAVTHVDGSAPPQTVRAATNPRFHEPIRYFRERTGVGVLVNTSFNERREPIVCTAADAYGFC